jgi:cysteine desulfurase
MSRDPVIYLDYNATTPLDTAIRDIVIEGFENWGNPSSVHQLGRRARAALDDARERVATVFRCRPSEIIFTGGGTEANNLAVLGTARARQSRGKHLICSPTEHPAVLECHRALARHEGFTLTLLHVDAEGRVSPEDVRKSLRQDTVLVSVMAANNETGTLQPVREIAHLCRDRGVLFHCDAVQWFGKQPWEGVASIGADLLTFCPHKLHGPRGIGVLYLRSPGMLERHALGGSQENDRRAGTENLPAILGLAATAERFVQSPVFPATTLRDFTRQIRDCLAAEPSVTLVSPEKDLLDNTLAFTVADSDSIALLANLDLEGICASSGSACSAGSVEPSHVVLAQGFGPAAASALVRFSLRRSTTAQEVASVVERLPRILARARSS